MTDEGVQMNEVAEAGSGETVLRPAARRRSFLVPVILVLLAFALGVALTIWAWPLLRRDQTPARATAPATAPTALAPAAQGRPLSVDAGQMLDARVIQLEERLNRISVEAQAASGNAARAEGLLVAFAARRAVDSGQPLGYIEGQLRLRFGPAQPRAVDAIINAARAPITLVDLRAGLLQIAERLKKGPAQTSWWESVEHEARALVTIRRDDTLSPRPDAALERALRYIDAGRVSAALAEVERMPGAASADRWAQGARRYLDARRALDLIETAAILEPRQLRGTEGDTVAQTSPLAP